MFFFTLSASIGWSQLFHGCPRWPQFAQASAFAGSNATIDIAVDREWRLDGVGSRPTREVSREMSRRLPVRELALGGNLEVGARLYPAYASVASSVRFSESSSSPSEDGGTIALALPWWGEAERFLLCEVDSTT